MITTSIAVTLGAIVAYLGLGSLFDRHRARREAQRRHAMAALTEATFLDFDSASQSLHDLKGVPPKVLWSLAMTVPLHFDDQLSRRILRLIGATNARRRIARLSRSRLWFQRVKAARLAHVLPAEEVALVDGLLNDPSAAVQAAALESFGTDQIARHATSILGLLNHPTQSVRFTAQQALLRGDGRITKSLRAWLREAKDDVAHFGLEVAAYLDDPRLVDEIQPFATSTNPTLRRLAARATPVGASREELGFFEALIDDGDPMVRVTAIESSSRIDADWLIPRVAHRLTDRSWKVRRAAGEALSRSGALGDMYLRAALNSHDPFAADMARSMLEIHGRPARSRVTTSDEQLDSLSAWVSR